MRTLYFSILVFILGCSGSTEQELTRKTIELHEEALAAGKAVDLAILRLGDRAAKAQEPLRSTIIDSLKIINDDYMLWKSALVEVPGHEHDHHDHHGHEHHQPAPDLTPEMAFHVQQDLRDRALKLNQRAQRLVETLTLEGK